MDELDELICDIHILVDTANALKQKVLALKEKRIVSVESPRFITETPMNALGSDALIGPHGVGGLHLIAEDCLPTKFAPHSFVVLRHGMLTINLYCGMVGETRIPIICFRCSGEWAYIDPQKTYPNDNYVLGLPELLKKFVASYPHDHEFKEALTAEIATIFEVP